MPGLKSGARGYVDVYSSGPGILLNIKMGDCFALIELPQISKSCKTLKTSKNPIWKNRNFMCVPQWLLLI